MAVVSADIGSVFFCVAKRFSAHALRLRSPCLLPFSRSRRLSPAAGVGVYRATSKGSNPRFPLTALTSSRAFSRRSATNASTTVDDSDVLTKIPPDDRIPATIITGFLGSGKTTLLNHILTADHGKRIAVIENEFGEIDIDGSLVAAKTTGVEDIVMLNNGCLCCTVRGDLVRMISELVEKKKGKFDHIVIETTGDPPGGFPSFKVASFGVVVLRLYLAKVVFIPAPLSISSAFQSPPVALDPSCWSLTLLPPLPVHF